MKTTACLIIWRDDKFYMAMTGGHHVSHNLLTKDGFIWMMINPSNNAKTGLRHADDSLIPYFRRKGAIIINEELRIVKIANLEKQGTL